jgi:hypothetical protein
VLTLVDYEIKTGRSFTSWQSIESAVTSPVPSEDWKGAYNVVPAPAIELRQKLSGYRVLAANVVQRLGLGVKDKA